MSSRSFDIIAGQWYNRDILYKRGRDMKKRSRLFSVLLSVCLFPLCFSLLVSHPLCAGIYRQIPFFEIPEGYGACTAKGGNTNFR